MNEPAPTQPVIRRAEPAEYSAVLALYQACGYTSGIREGDIVWMVEMDHQLVGAARLCCDHQLWVLRGMQVRPDRQRQGIGGKLVDAVLQHLDGQTCYCVPYAHLRPFYGRFGFTKVRQENMPPYLAERMTDYRSRGLGVILMCRAGKQGLR